MGRHHKNFPKDEFKRLKDANRRLKSDINKLKAEIRALEDTLQRTILFLQNETNEVHLQALMEGASNGDNLEKIKNDSLTCKKCHKLSIKTIKSVDKIAKVS